METFTTFNEAITSGVNDLLLNGKEVNTTSWQGKTNKQFATLEVMNYSFSCPIPSNRENLAKEIKPNLPWASDHFGERIGGKPLNPGEQYKSWPYYLKDEFRTEDDKFTHTYMERFWPKLAGIPHNMSFFGQSRRGIRYPYGDLNDVIDLLSRDPLTRQAYFPIWFPEDTGVVHRGRVPCTLGYHFLCRDDKLHIFYDIRSCDALRHFQDDIYLACRLLLFVLLSLQVGGDTSFWDSITPGNLNMHIFSFHIFKVDIDVLKYRLKEGLI